MIKPNRAIAEEYARIAAIYRRPSRIGCRNESCASFGVPLDLAPSRYRAFGTTAGGDPRFQCKACQKTFSKGSPTRRHKRTDRTGDILLGLVNKVPLSRICELNGVSFPQVYSKIDFIHRQCLAMAARREQNLPRRFTGSANFFATDAQTLMVNWPAKSRRGTIPLLHMATVHQGTQFVVAATVDYDPSMSADEVDRQMEACGDFGLPRSMRKHARLWSAREYRNAIMRGLPGIFAPEDIATGGQFRLPGRGARVRGDAFMYAHMMLVRKLVGRDGRRNTLCIDAEAGLAAAIAALSTADVRAGKVQVVEVSFAKGLTNDERNRLARAGKEAFSMMRELYAEGIRAALDEFPSLSVQEALILHLLRDSFEELPPDRRGHLLAAQGVPWPFHTKAEPRKTLRLTTDRGEMGWDDLARTICGATIHPVDAWFNFIRRRVSAFERGLPTASNAQRIWHAYGLYDPSLVPKLVDILRFYHNWMLPASDRSGATPAMKVGLARGLIYPRDLFAV